MELKNYQKSVMKDLTNYISILNQENDFHKAWKRFWNEQDIAVGLGGVPAYQNNIKGVPHVCMKVPTGGGKTYMACSAVKRIFDELPQGKPKIVVWLVPSDPILVQTTKNLMNPEHPYRQRLNIDFAGRVSVYTKEMLLNGQNFSPDTVQEQLTVCILSYGSLRIDSKKKDVRKVYQENGSLLKFAEYFRDDSALLADTPDTALIQVLRKLQPVVIVDESHNAESNLSIEMLNNLNPSLILDLTATPRKNSNIISYVDARELKKENMVKLPVIVYNRSSRNTVIENAIQLRDILEQQAIAEEQESGNYIRPIVLFQAQPKTSNDSDTFQKVKQMLIEVGIPENQIAIKTSKVDDLGKVDLMSRDCEIRYIITVNALKEGWDCPFAYILASLANKTSRVDVEQILGRILRQPYARKHKSKLLNKSYVLTCSNAFHDTLDSIIKGLNNAGFSRDDYRIGSEETREVPENPPVQPPLPETSKVPESEQTDNFEDIDTSAIQIKPVSENHEEHTVIEEMISHAEQQEQIYETEAEKIEISGFIGGEKGDMLKQYHIQPQYAEQMKDFLLPQFFLNVSQDMFGGAADLLDKNALLDGFTLSEQDAVINFSLSTGEMFEVDVQEEGNSVPKYKKVSQIESEYLQNLFAKMTAPEEKIASCTRQICEIINRDKTFSAEEISNYVHRVVNHMTEDELSVMETSFIIYANRIMQKIKSLQETYSEKMFDKWVTLGFITCQESYKFPDVISPAESIDSVPLSLYEAECNRMNNFEKSICDIFAELENVEWWHRIIDRKGFCLNGFINHYPDFVVKMKSGRILLVESKGDDRDNSDSKAKLKLGQKWADLSGKQYRYFMVFDDNPIEGAYTVADFAEMLKNM